MKKEKVIIPPILSVESLNEYDKQRWRDMEEKRAVVQKEGEAVLFKALDAQAEIHTKLTKALGIVTKMEDEYIALEEKIGVEKKSAIDAKNVTMADVQAGKITVTELIAKGMKEGQILAEARSQTDKELEEARSVIRVKRLEIIQLEHDLYVQRQMVFAMRLRPAMDLVKAYKDHAETLERESSGLHIDRIQSDSALALKKTELLLCDGKTLGAGHVWDSLTLELAHKLVLNPVFPEHLIPELKRELAKEGVKEPITVQLHFGLGGPNPDPNVPESKGAQMTVSPTPQAGEPVTTSSGVFGRLLRKREVSEQESVEKESAEIKKKILTTSEIDVSRDSHIIHKVKEE